MHMPEPDAAIIAKRPEIVDQLNRLVPAGPFGTNVITDPDGLRAYECDGLSAYRQLPMVVVLPETTVQVSEILKYCDGAGVKVVPRGAGTSLSGGVRLILTALDLLIPPFIRSTL